VPTELLTQARLAARHQVRLDSVLRGYVAGSTLIEDFTLDECDSPSAQSVLRLRGAALEHLLSCISTEFELERQSRSTSRESRTFEQVSKLLQGARLDTTDLNYDLTLNHVAFIAHGPEAKRCSRNLLRSVDCRLLLIEVAPGTAWGWLGRRAPIYSDEVGGALTPLQNHDIAVGIGEPSPGVAGWRQTHRQAKAALPVAMRSAARLARYADVCLIASAIQDPLLTDFLREIYLEPLLTGRDRGATHLRTLRAYFAAQRNGKSTASALGISRQAVGRRLRVIEGRIGRPLPACASEIEAAIQIEDLTT